MFRAASLTLCASIFLFSCSHYEFSGPSIQSSSFNVTLARADSLLRVEEVDSAKSLFSSVLLEQTGNLPALIGLGQSTLKKREWDEAIDVSARILRIDTSSLPAYYLAAVANRERGTGSLFRTRDWGVSRREFESILARDSSYEDVLLQYAVLERYAENRDHALSLARAQVFRKPSLEGPQLGLYKLQRFYAATLDSTDFTSWLTEKSSSTSRYVLGEWLRRHGNLTMAATQFLDLLVDSGDVPLQALFLSLSRLRMAQGDSAGAEGEYWNAVSTLHSPIGAAILFEDLKYILSDQELDYYKSLRSVSQKRDFFKSYWNFRNPSLALNTNLRLQEHIRRQVFAEGHYEHYGFRTAFNNPDKLHELQFPRVFSLNEEYNDMGLIYLRQGAPRDVLRHDYSPFDEEEDSDPRMSILVQKEKNGGLTRDEKAWLAELRRLALNDEVGSNGAHDAFESWLYDATPESPRMIFHFQKHEFGGNGWRLVLVPPGEAMLAELQLWDSKFQRMYMAREGDRAPDQTRVKAESKGIVKYGLSTEKYTPDKETQTFQFPYRIDLFRGEGGKTLMDVSYAIPLEPISHSLPDSILSTPVEVGFALVDAHSHHALRQVDTVQVGFSRTRTGMILDLIRYSVPPDSYAVSMHLRPLYSQMISTWRQTLRVRDFSRPDFMLSSIQFLRPSTEIGSLNIDGVKVVQSPFWTNIQTEPLLLYFQVYHLVPDAFGSTSYRTECILLPRGEQDMGKGTLVYKSEKTGKEEMAAVFCQIDLHAMDPGQYNLFVSVTDRKRVQTLTAVRELIILKQ